MRNLPKLIPNHHRAYSTDIESINNNTEGLYLLDSPRCTGKTFVIKLFLAKVCQENKITLATATSGICSHLNYLKVRLPIQHSSYL